MRSPRDLIGTQPVCPSDDAETGARALSRDEVEQLRDDFIAAAVRAERAGFDGVELHGAHGYVLCQFLCPETNRRTDEYGGSLENRSPPAVRHRRRHPRALPQRLHAWASGCRPSGSACASTRRGPSPQLLINSGSIDFLDLSLWDVFKEPQDEPFRGRSLLSYFTDLRARQRQARRGRQDHQRARCGARASQPASTSS